ncbi:MAG: SUMF1/EgtB/PvdO family nonheme iron enzyme [Bacteroidota bacterium]
MALRFALALLLAVPASAADLRIENVRLDLASRDTSANTIAVTFDVHLEDSWREGESWDAVWMFAGFEREPGVWGDLRFTPNGHAFTSSTDLALTPSLLPAGHARGLLLHRAADGRGDLRASVRALWTPGASFFDLPEAGVAVRVHGVELVRVPGGAFTVGGSEEPNAFRAGSGGPFEIAREGAIPVADSAGTLFYDVPEGEAYAGGDQRGPIPATFPSGFGAFYAMKYPILQGQYAAFLSALQPRARAARNVSIATDYTETGGTITCGSVNCEAALPSRAAAHLTWADGIGWASWAGLRPMTELEYEKAAEGTPADSARYADGSPPDRADQSGRASRWGAVDLRGGLWERVVTVGTREGRSYRGSPGQGFVDDAGLPYAFANLDWPGARAVGSGYRGGTEGLLGLSEVTDRTYGAYEATYGNQSQGFRCVLDAPSAP